MNSTLSTTDEVLARLTALVGANDLTLRPICTRLMLRTGVNLREPRDTQRNDQTLVAKVVAELSAMGYAV